MTPMRNLTRIALVLVILFGLAPKVQAIDVTFLDSASVDGKVIKLGDIATFSDQSIFAQALASLELGPAPAPGEATFLSADAVSRYLTGRNSLPDSISWQGAPNIAVKRNAVIIGPEKIAELIASFITANKQSLPEADIRFVPDSFPLPFALPVGDAKTEITPSNPAILGSSLFSIIFRVDGSVVKNLSVRGKIEAIAKIVVAARPLGRNSVLRAEDLTLAETDIGNIVQPNFRMDGLVGKKLDRSLRAGQPVLESMIETLPIVHRGEKVKMVIISGPMELTATGLAASDGKKNEMIQVLNIGSNKLIYCRVAAPGIVEVTL